MSKPKTKTTTKTQWRVMVKFRWSSRFVQTKDYYGPRTYRSLADAKEWVQAALDPESGFRYGYRTWPFEGAEFRTEGRTITVTTETGDWQLASKLAAETGHSTMGLVS